MDDEVVPVLRVASAADAVEWYERLGFAKQWEHRFEPGMPAFVSIARGKARLSLIGRPDQDVPVPAAACRMAFTAYPGGSRSGGLRGTSVIWSGAAVIPHSSTCGGAGMSWTAGAGCV